MVEQFCISYTLIDTCRGDTLVVNNNLTTLPYKCCLEKNPKKPVLHGKIGKSLTLDIEARRWRLEWPHQLSV